jgi:hypothetical protein
VNSLERSLCLGLRRHSAAKRFAAGNDRIFGKYSQRCADCGPDSCLRQLRRIGPFRATFHVRKLVAQCGNAARGKLGGHSCHEGVIHSSTGAVSQYIASLRVNRPLQQTGHTNGAAYWNTDGFISRRRHEQSTKTLCWIKTADHVRIGSFAKV